MLLAGRKPDHIARPDFLDRTAPTLHPSHPCSDDERLSERMGVPGGAGARLESYAGTSAARRLRRLEERIDTDRAREIVRRTLAGRLRGPLRLISINPILGSVSAATTGVALNATRPPAAESKWRRVIMGPPMRQLVNSPAALRLVVEI